MHEALHARRTEAVQVQKTANQKSSSVKHPLQRTVDARKHSSYTEAWGNQLPPWLRLGSSEQSSHQQENAEPVQKKENKTGLPDTLKAGVENLSGFSMDDVHVHYNSPKTAEVQALAYTQGTEIHVGPGQEQHLAHEAWHVVQQKQGRVRSTMQMKGAEINDDRGLEREADEIGAKIRDEAESVGHSQECCCSACASQAAKMGSGGDSTATQIHVSSEDGSSPLPIQRCKLCGDPTCLNGEKCKRDATFEGLFPPGSDTMTVGPYNELKLLGSHGGTTQLEHPIPGLSLRKSGLGSFYKTSPTITMPWDIHQEGRYGKGGGITSTGGSTVAREWSQGIAQDVKSGNTKDALRNIIIDAINAAEMNNVLSIDWANGYVQVINSYATEGMINQTEAGELRDFCVSLVYHRLKL